ncbi:hypothetical protein Dvina_51250 [Dactylosporangium vinaceum]|uniref:Integral membrane protein n=1 Tax=Dactylosporangium vinaceum TaxID=53362 RepID=A0ABV5M2M4_9ACTN|nr:hypothetical protein [Dactylosporangium vinaceum]UAB96226.1 hypothetical protein Dvina_51250 [Dactylosporangium vinaceum]
MSASRIIVALYPPAVRERWGAEIGREVAERGARTWPDAVVGAVRLWLHPGDWPETAAGQTRRVLAVAVFAVTAAATLLLRAAEPAPPPQLTLLCLATLTAGALIAAPLPPLTWHTARVLAALTARTMALPVVLMLGMVMLANSGAVEHPGRVGDVALVAYYWCALAYVALRTCTLVARVLPSCVVPTKRRLRSALLLAGAGAALAAAQGALVAVHTAVTGGVWVSAALALLAAATLQAGRNLDRPAVT